MRLVCVSDTHLRHDFTVPDGDVLIHAGDGTHLGEPREVEAWFSWLAALPHAHKVIIAGNHDFLFQRVPEMIPALLPKGVIYLQDSGVEIEGLKIWGSPWQPWFFDWAFNLERGPAIAKAWAKIPDDTEVLITHGPPADILDKVPNGDHVGCEDLRARVKQLSKLKLHVFGHIHHSYGKRTIGGVTYINASTCSEQYWPTNAPIIIDL